MNNPQDKRAIRVVLAEPQPVFMKASVQELAAPDIEVVAATALGQEAIELIRRQTPDVAVIAQQFRDVSGIDILHQTREFAPTLFFTQVDSQEVVFEALMLGARGYLLKWYSDISLADGVRRVAGGGFAIGSITMDLFIRAVQNRVKLHRDTTMLTPREREILTLISEGHRMYLIGPMLGLQPSTVQTHVKNSYRKLGVSSQAQAVREAIRLGLIGASSDEAFRTSQSSLPAPAPPP